MSKRKICVLIDGYTIKGGQAPGPMAKIKIISGI